MTTVSSSDQTQGRPLILGTAKVASSSLFPKYPTRECENLIRLLVEDITGAPWHRVLMYPDMRFSPQQLVDFQHAVARLAAMEPIQYILGHAWFDGLKLKVGPGVLIPRPETEELVDWADSAIEHINSPQILDICTGSGCIPLAFKQRRADAKVTGLDVSEEALSFARLNSADLALQVDWILCDVLQASPTLFQNLDLIVCNPPYIPATELAQMSTNVTEYEPSLALFVPDEDPLLFYRAVSGIAFNWLKPGGLLFFEIHEDFGEAMKSLMTDQGFSAVEIREDMQGKARMAHGQKPK